MAEPMATPPVDEPPQLRSRMNPSQRSPGPHTSHAAIAAEHLRDALGEIGISADVHEGHGVALVSVWTDLLVWTDGFVYRWWTGQISARTRRRMYTTYGTDTPIAVARSVAHRRSQLQEARRPAVFGEGTR